VLRTDAKKVMKRHDADIMLFAGHHESFLQSKSFPQDVKFLDFMQNGVCETEENQWSVKNQAESFSEELQLFSSGQTCVKQRSKLDLLINDEDIGGQLPYDVKCPLKDHTSSHLIVHHSQKKICHQRKGLDKVKNHAFWIL
jgi:hypothetical protein